MINLHFSLLPRWRGAAPVERAILAGDTETGVCVMTLEEGLDTGPVHARRVVPSAPTRPPTSCGGAGGTGHRAAGGPAADGLSPAVPQEGEATYAAKIDPRSCTSTGPSRRSRSTGWCASGGRGPPSGASASGCSGRLVGGPAGPASSMVVVGRGRSLELVEVQPEGRDPMPAFAWVNGARPRARRTVGVDCDPGAVQPEGRGTAQAAAACSATVPVRPPAKRAPPTRDPVTDRSKPAGRATGIGEAGTGRGNAAARRRRQPARSPAAARRWPSRHCRGRWHSGAGSRANVVVPHLLGASGLARRTGRLSTELVYGTVRMQRACDWLVDRHVRRPIDAPARAALRLGVYQLAFLPRRPHAAVSATVDEVAGTRARGLVNAMLRRVADDVRPAWRGRPTPPGSAIPTGSSGGCPRRSAPTCVAALAQMNRRPLTHRADGYMQDLASQWVAAAVGAGPGERVADLCAAPGGKATFLA